MGTGASIGTTMIPRGSLLRQPDGAEAVAGGAGGGSTGVLATLAAGARLDDPL
jgi:hypothetical protein